MRQNAQGEVGNLVFLPAVKDFENTWQSNCHEFGGFFDFVQDLKITH